MESNYLASALNKITLKQVLIFLSLFLGVLFVISLPFLINFYKFSFSKESTDWGEYGSYISGITSILNLIVFVLLTVYVAQLGDSNNYERLKSEKEFNRQRLVNERIISREQLETQRKVLLVQFRQSELNKLTDQLYKPNDNLRFGELKPIFFSFSLLYSQVVYIEKQKHNIFPIIDSSEELRETIKLYIADINTFLTLIGKINFFKDLDEEGQNKFILLSTAIMRNRDEILRLLQDSILKELE